MSGADGEHAPDACLFSWVLLCLELAVPLMYWPMEISSHGAQFCPSPLERSDRSRFA